MSQAFTPTLARVGQERFASINALLNETLAAHRPLIVAHRGAPRGAIRENTLRGVIATRNIGADMAEIDIVRSADGEYFTFHDGYEPARLNEPRKLGELSSAEISQLCYNDFEGISFGRVEPTSYILHSMPRMLINIDRSWRYWDGFLDWLDQFGLEEQLVMKSRTDAEYVNLLREHAVKFMYMAMVENVEQVHELEALARDPELNLVGVELMVHDADHTEFLDRGVFDYLHGLGLYTLVNAMDLGNGYRGFGGLDDDTSILEGPEAGWGRIVDGYGVDMIQTDWPEMLREWRDGR